MSKIFKASLIIGVSFGLNKLLALLRQYLIATQFGFTKEIDAFNVANNMPDLIFSLFSGGALAMAFIPVFAEYLDIKGQDLSWKLFSKVATLLFMVTAVASLVIAIIAPFLVSSPVGVAPGFTVSQQALVVSLLRINLVATLLFSVSGLVTASLQAHKHFLLPAIAPLFYNVGIIIGILFLSPITPITILGFPLPSMHLGIYGLTYGVVLGALLHWLIQIPGMFYYKFHFTFAIDLNDEGIRKIFRLMWPRLLTVLLIQITFLLRDNFASRLQSGSVTALTYGYFIMQVPETLIGSSIAIALLPSLATYMSKNKQTEFSHALLTSIRVLIAASFIPTVLVFTSLAPLVEYVFDFSASNAELLVWTTHAFMAGLLTQVLLEVFVRVYYAKQQAMIPLFATLLRTILFIILGVALYQRTGVVGIAAIDSITIAVETIFLFILLLPSIPQKIKIVQTFGRSIMGSVAMIGIFWVTLSFLHVPILMQISIAAVVATAVYTLFVLKEMKLFMKL